MAKNNIDNEYMYDSIFSMRQAIQDSKNEIIKQVELATGKKHIIIKTNEKSIETYVDQETYEDIIYVEK